MNIVALFAFLNYGSAQTQKISIIPHLEKQGAVTHLIVDGKPWLSLAGELLNNAASTAENVRPVWPDLAKANLNTVLVGVGWGWIEPEEGKFNFSAIDGVLQDARKNNLHVVILWFGSWKNGTSSYAPAWVKRNWEKYPIARDKNGKGMEILSTLSAANRDADARAFAALMRHVREVDSSTRTVIMIQLENEVGLIGDSRDRCKEANEAFAGMVPDAQMFSPFGIERQAGGDDSQLSDAYDLLSQMTPLIMEHQGNGTMKAVILEANWGPQQVQLGNYIFDIAIGRGWGARAQSAGRGYAILIQAGPDNFWVAGANLNIRFSSTLTEAPMASLAAVEEGRFENGVWVVGRHLAGDDTGMGADQRCQPGPGWFNQC